MSGGSYDYAYTKVLDVAEALSSKRHSALRRAFASHLFEVAEAMHAIEWVDSGDYAKDDEIVPIEKALGANAAQIELPVLLADARELVSALEAASGKALKGATR